VLHPLTRALAALGVAAAALLAAAPAASAHAVLRSTNPRAGATIGRLPERVVVTFDDTIGTPAYVTVTGPDGRADTGDALVDGDSVSVALRAGGSAGDYTVAYRVVSDDGHPVEGTFDFRLSGAPTSPAPSSVPSSAPSSGSSAAAVAPTVPSARADAAAAPGQAGTPTDDGHDRHWFAGIAGAAMVVAGAGALVWERRQRGRAGTRS
jgi:methionine-rich copper-binding protein CopC